MVFKKFIIAIGVICLFVPLCWAQDNSDLPSAVITEQEMVVTANPLATQAGADILKMGGTAADAMVAVQTVLGLVEPQSSGLGGGAFIVYYDANTGKLVDMFKAGIIDPAKVARTALQNAASVAGLMLTTNVLVTELKDKDKDKEPIPDSVR